jgi:16S rRNA processing protein RimM
VAVSAPDRAAVIVMGRVIGAYGVRGMVKIQPLSEDPLALTRHSTWWMSDGADWHPHRVSDARMHGGTLVALLDGVPDREAAAALRGTEIGVARTQLPALAPDELYWSDLEGLVVVNREGECLGRVVGVIDNGAHAILRVQSEDADERLVPWVPAHVDRVDAAGGRIEVDWPADF